MVIRKLHESVVEKVVVFDVALFWRDCAWGGGGGNLRWLTLKWRLACLILCRCETLLQAEHFLVELHGAFQVGDVEMRFKKF